MVVPLSAAPSATVPVPGAAAPTPDAGAFAAALASTLARSGAAAGQLLTLGQMVDLRASGGPGALPTATPVQPFPAAAAVPPLWAVPAAAGMAGPVTAPDAAGLQVPVVGRVTSSFGPRVHPISGRHKHHSGLDIAAPVGTPIAAAAGGTVTFAGVRGGYGNLVIVDHGDGRETRYAHADRLLVQPGQRVVAGQQVGTVGATGTATGPHLHLEVRVGGEAVDPAPLLGQ